MIMSRVDISGFNRIWALDILSNVTSRLTVVHQGSSGIELMTVLKPFIREEAQHDR